MLLVEAFPLSVCVVCACVYRCVCLCVRFHFILPGAVLDYNLSPKMLIVRCALLKVLLCKLSPITINLLPSAIVYHNSINLLHIVCCYKIKAYTIVSKYSIVSCYIYIHGSTQGRGWYTGLVLTIPQTRIHCT